MKNIFLLLLCACILVGCATTAKYEALLDTYTNATEETLLASWGVPSQVYESGGSKYLVYDRSRQVFNPGMQPMYQTTVRGNTAYTYAYGGIPARYENYYCTTTFTLKENRIVHWQYRGNNCVSNYTPPKSQYSP